MSTAVPLPPPCALFDGILEVVYIFFNTSQPRILDDRLDLKNVDETLVSKVVGVIDLEAVEASAFFDKMAMALREAKLRLEKGRFGRWGFLSI